MTEMKGNETGAHGAAMRGALSPREERLLARYHDGECGWVGRYLAERLITRRAPARSYVEALQKIQRLSRERPAGSVGVDLWSGIAARIAQEERAAVFLGRRGESWAERLAGFVREHRHIAWGIPSGAALAGMVLLFMAPVNNYPGSAPTGVARVGGGGAPVVNLASAGNGRPVGQFRDPVEVDWVRGSGRVRVMQDPHRNSAVIWVRRPQTPKFLPGERGDRVVPLEVTPRSTR